MTPPTPLALSRLPALPLLAAVLLLSCTAASAQVIGHSGGGWSMRGTDPIMIFHGERHVTSYNAGYEEGRPYFYPVVGPTGENMTRHWPMREGVDQAEQTDHPHHRGLWYGLGNVNGLDFWHNPRRQAEGSKSGLIRHTGMTGVSMSSDGILFRTRSEWVAQADPEKRVLSDRREFRLFDRPDGTLVLDAAITLVADAGDVTIGDDKEGAWAIRVMPTLRLEGDVAAGAIVNSEGVSGREAWGKRAAWVHYYGNDRRGNPVGIAMLDHPSNPRHPTWWHARHYGLFTANPFGQGNFERDAREDAGNLVIPNGEEITFRYRTIFHPGGPEEAALAEAFEAFAGEE